MIERRQPTTVQAMVWSTALTSITGIQWFTVAWMTVEVVVALTTAVRSRSVALAAFGADSGIELVSAVTVLWRFRTKHTEAEATATKITGWLLVALAVFIVCQSLYTLLGRGFRRASGFPLDGFFDRDALHFLLALSVIPASRPKKH